LVLFHDRIPIIDMKYLQLDLAERGIGPLAKKAIEPSCSMAVNAVNPQHALQRTIELDLQSKLVVNLIKHQT